MYTNKNGTVSVNSCIYCPKTGNVTDPTGNGQQELLYILNTAHLSLSHTSLRLSIKRGSKGPGGSGLSLGTP